MRQPLPPPTRQRHQVSFPVVSRVTDQAYRSVHAAPSILVLVERKFRRRMRDCVLNLAIGLLLGIGGVGGAIPEGASVIAIRAEASMVQLADLSLWSIGPEPSGRSRTGELDVLLDAGRHTL